MGHEIELPDTKWLVDNLIPVKSIGVLYGAPGTFKTFLAMHIADMLASRRPVLGHASEPDNPDVVYVATEGGHNLRYRIDAARRVHGDTPSVGFVRQMLDLRSNMTDCDALVEAISAKGLRPCLIVVDTLAKTFGGGNENDGQDMAAFGHVMSMLREKTGSAVLVIHHSGKDPTKNERGSSNLRGDIDYVFRTKRTASPLDTSSPGGGNILVQKQRDGQDDYSMDYAVELVKFEDGESSLAIREWKDGEARGVELAEVKLSVAAHAALEILRGQISEAGGEGRSDVWKRGVLLRDICTEDTWPGVRKELKLAGAILTLGGKKLAIGASFAVSDFENTQSTPNPQLGGQQVVENKHCSKPQSTLIHTQSTPNPHPRIGVD